MTARASANQEAVLLARAASGDEEAVGVLYASYAGPLYAYGLRRLDDGELAEELVQTVMTRLWRSRTRYDPERGSVRTFVYVIARSVATDLHRRRLRRAEPRDDLPELAAADELDDLLRAEAVRAALDRLSPEHREVLELAYYRGLSQPLIADRLGLPLGTVKSRTFYALKAFRLACDELGVEP